MKKIKLGYSIPEAKEIFIEPSHLIVTGVTQLSGKTTTLEALISRHIGSKAIVFKTKPGEKSFSSGKTTAPFFRDRSDYEFVRSLIEAYSGDKMYIEKGTLMKLCKGTGNLIEIKKRVDDEMAGGKLRGINLEIYTRLQHYLENLIPQIQYAGLSRTLTLFDGINIMDITNFSYEAQSLIVSSVAEEILKNYTNTILVIAEAWKFLPQKKNNPCKAEVVKFIRQGAANNNFIWLDSQDMSGVDKEPLKQISTWILGYQAERNEVKHTLDQISLPAKSKPKVDEIMNLQLGQFFLSSRDQVIKVYVQPTWVSDSDAILIASGDKDVKSQVAPVVMPRLDLQTEKPSFNIPKQNGFHGNELAEIRKDFYEKIQLLNDNQNKFFQQVNEWASQLQIPSIESIANHVLQKIPQPQAPAFKPAQQNNINIDELIAAIIPKLPQSTGSVTYTVSPLDKIKKDFLNEIKNKIITDITSLSTDEKKALKYIEARSVDIAPNEMVTQCFMLKPGGSASVKVSNIFKALLSVEAVEKTAGGRYRANLKKRIVALMNNHEASEQEIQSTYDHIIHSLI